MSILKEKITITKTETSRIGEMNENNIAFGKLYSDHMFLADYENGEWKNKRITPYQNLSLSPACTTLHYSQTIFEGLKAYRTEKGKIVVFRPQDNAKRLNKSAERMCIPAVPQELFMEGLTELIHLDKNWVPSRPGTSLYIRPTVFATDPFIGVKVASQYLFYIITSPAGMYFSEPLKVKIETNYTRAAPGGTGYAKTGGNYSGSHFPTMQAIKEGFHQILWTDATEHSYFEESGAMNIMFFKNNTLITPALTDSILAGINRESVLTLAKEWGIQVEERKISVKEILEDLQNNTLQEVFGVGTAVTIAPIQMIGYQGKNYSLPLHKDSFASRMFDKLDSIKYGKEIDTHNWIYTIPS
ncbi:MAG: branched-chain amino acid aminotransferase [Chitinophagaceae bacterium]|nr:branched-chain amino acid aminotransferase [Chitinophagaceae bacterium]